MRDTAAVNTRPQPGSPRNDLDGARAEHCGARTALL